MIDVNIAEVRRFTTIAADIVSDETIVESNTQVFALVKGKTGFIFEDTEVTEKYDGDGTNELILENYPVTAVTSLSVDDDTVDPDNILVYNDDGIIKLDNDYLFTKDLQNVEVSYSYFNGDEIELVSSLIYYMVCLDVLLIAGNTVSEGAQRNSFDDYTIAFDGLPYGSQIRLLQKRVDDILIDLGEKPGISIIS